ncbi:MAG: zf-TFIIB domain-containing protein [Leptospirales bacterium]|nr:zf-TFIIB domain-containing protein [Leptospirales bacterium]
MWEYLIKALRPLSTRAPDSDIRAPHGASGAEAGRSAEHTPATQLRHESAGGAAGTAPQRDLKQRGLQCPQCAATMQTKLLDSVAIDECPGCGGVFLDRGELEEIRGEWHEERAGRGSLLLYTPHGLTDHVRDSHD